MEVPYLIKLLKSLFNLRSIRGSSTLRSIPIIPFLREHHLRGRGAVGEAAGVAFAEGQADPVEVLADGHGVATGGPEEVAQFGHRDGCIGVEACDDAAAQI